MSVTKKGTGCEAKKISNQAEQGSSMGMTVTTVVSPGNPSNVDKFESVIQGTTVEITHIDSVSNYCHEDMKVSNSNRGESGPKFKHNGQPTMGLNEDLDNVLFTSKTNEGQMDAIPLERQSHELDISTSSPDMIGPSNYKPKGTWTRINRMDFGLGGFTKAITLPGLGKRESHEAQGGQIEEQSFKKGKLSSDEESNNHGSDGNMHVRNKKITDLLYS